MESPQQNNPIEKPEGHFLDRIDVPGHHSAYITGNRVSVIRSDGKMDYDWILSEIGENDVKIVKSIDGKLKEKIVSRDDFIHEQTLAGDRRTYARQLRSDDEDFMRTENFASEINVGKHLEQIKDEKIETEEEAKRFLEEFAGGRRYSTGNSFDYQRAWNEKSEELKQKIIEHREKFGRDSNAFKLLVFRMKQMNEAKKFIFPEQGQSHDIEDTNVENFDVPNVDSGAIEQILNEKARRGLSPGHPDSMIEILKLYNINNTGWCENFDEFREITQTGLPFKITREEDGNFKLVYSEQSKPFTFLSNLVSANGNEKASEILANYLNQAFNNLKVNK